jgi:hypothetical protein
MGSLRVGIMVCVSVTRTVLLLLLLLSGTSMERAVVVERSTKGRSTKLTPHHPFKQLEWVRKRKHVKRVWMVVGVLMMASREHSWMMVIVMVKG